jgi:hypothetical protein
VRSLSFGQVAIHFDWDSLRFMSSPAKSFYEFTSKIVLSIHQQNRFMSSGAEPFYEFTSRIVLWVHQQNRVIGSPAESFYEFRSRIVLWVHQQNVRKVPSDSSPLPPPPPQILISPSFTIILPCNSVIIIPAVGTSLFHNRIMRQTIVTSCLFTLAWIKIQPRN